jgi:hypothetical protein
MNSSEKIFDNNILEQLQTPQIRASTFNLRALYFLGLFFYMCYCKNLKEEPSNLL